MPREQTCRQRIRYEIGTLPARLVHLEGQPLPLWMQPRGLMHQQARADHALPDWHANCYSKPAGMDAIVSQAGDSDRNVDAQV
jgi:hypothetical protein